MRVCLLYPGSAASIVCGPRGWRAGRADHRPAGTEARATAPVGAPAVVGGAGRVRRLHAVRRALQRVQRARGRAALHASRPAARRRLLTSHAASHHPQTLGLRHTTVTYVRLYFRRQSLRSRTVRHSQHA